MKKITLIASAKFNLEQVVEAEVKALGFNHISTSAGKVEFEATLDQIPTANLWLRCADRVLIKMGEFKASSFDQLFEQTKALPWERLITPDGKFPVTGNCVNSTLRSVRSSQSIVKKAVVNRLKEQYTIDWFEETGASFNIHVSLLNNVATLTIDTSGDGLHKRGYRRSSVTAPLKETLAAGLVMLSSWQTDGRLIDPMCGSGTILIEAAMMARNIAPGLKRPFASEKWPSIETAVWQKARADAKQAIKPSQEPHLFGYDINKTNVKASKENAHLAGVGNDILFARKDIKDLWIDRQFGTVISNPPYGMRIAEFSELDHIYRALNKIFKKKTGWSLFILTADEKFPSFFKRALPDKKVLLNNGRLRATYYHYLAK